MKIKKFFPLLLVGLFLTGCVNQNNELSIESSEPVSSEIVSLEGTYSSSSVHEHDYVFYEKVNPSYRRDGYKAHYECRNCDLIFDENKIETTLDAIKLAGATVLVGLMVNQTYIGELTVLSANANEGIFEYTNVNISEGDQVYLVNPNKRNIEFDYFPGNNIDSDHKSSITGKCDVEVHGTLNGFTVTLEKSDKVLTVVNGMKYVMHNVNYYKSDMKTYIYGYHNFKVGDKMYIDDQITNNKYYYADLADDTTWNTYDFHKDTTTNEIVFDVAGRYGIEFDRGGDRKISITKAFAPNVEGSFDVVIDKANSVNTQLLENTYLPNSEEYNSFCWYINTEWVNNAEDIRAAITNGIKYYINSVNLAANDKFRIANVTDSNNVTYINGDHLVGLHVNSGDIIINGEFIQCKKTGRYEIGYLPVADSIFIFTSSAPSTETIYCSGSGVSGALTIDASNCVTIANKHFDKNNYLAFYKINGSNVTYLPITLASSVDSTVAHIQTAPSGNNTITMLYFDKPGTFTVVVNLTNNEVSLTYTLDTVEDNHTYYYYFAGFNLDKTVRANNILQSMTKSGDNYVVTNFHLYANDIVYINRMDEDANSTDYKALADNQDMTLVEMYAGIYPMMKVEGDYDITFSTVTEKILITPHN